MAVQQPIAFAFNKTLVGRELDVLIDAPAPEGKHLWLGRTYADAPDVDGVTFVQGAHLRAGDLVRCEVMAAEGYDLIARASGQAPPPRRKRTRPKPRKRPTNSLAILDNG
jgi:ribosomal protein S12 methylthiotransferase